MCASVLSVGSVPTCREGTERSRAIVDSDREGRPSLAGGVGRAGRARLGHRVVQVARDVSCLCLARSRFCAGHVLRSDRGCRSRSATRTRWSAGLGQPDSGRSRPLAARSAASRGRGGRGVGERPPGRDSEDGHQGGARGHREHELGRQDEAVPHDRGASRSVARHVWPNTGRSSSSSIAAWAGAASGRSSRTARRQSACSTPRRRASPSDYRWRSSCADASRTLPEPG